MSFLSAARKFLGVDNAPEFMIGDTLASLLSQAGLKLMDIGARGGAMFDLALLAPFAHYYACEPDVEEAQALPQKLREGSSWREVTIIPEAIATSEAGATLYITKYPGLSSLLRPNESVIKRFYRGDEFQVEATLAVPTIALDHAAEKYGFRDTCFLKIDTQGTELDILQSGEKLLQETVLGVYIEVEFHPFYTEQPLFADVDSYLRGFGFSLFDLHRSRLRRASYREDLYSRRQVVWAHALYLKEPVAFLELDSRTALRFSSRLLGLALAFEHYDLALELVTSHKSAAVIQETFGRQIGDDVEAFISYRTKRILKKLKASTPTPSPLAFSHKDGRQPYC